MGKKMQKNACITSQPLLLLIIMNQREGCFIPDGNGNALLGQ